jgi:hypothetical protein
MFVNRDWKIPGLEPFSVQFDRLLRSPLFRLILAPTLQRYLVRGWQPKIDILK